MAGSCSRRSGRTQQPQPPAEGGLALQGAAFDVPTDIAAKIQERSEELTTRGFTLDTPKSLPMEEDSGRCVLCQAARACAAPDSVHLESWKVVLGQALCSAACKLQAVRCRGSPHLRADTACSG